MRLSFLRQIVLMLVFVLSASCQSVDAVAVNQKSQVYIERVPEGSLLYVGWAGADADVRGYEGSKLQGMVESSNVKEVLSEMLPAALNRLAMEKPEVGMFKPTIEFVAKVLWKQQFALVVTDVDLNRGPKAAFLVEGGEDVKALKNMLNLMLLGMSEQMQAMVKMIDGNDGELLITFGEFDEETLAVLKGEEAGGVGHMKGLVGDPVQVVYVNVGGIYKIVEEKFMKGKNGFGMGSLELAIVEDVLALDKMGSVTMSAGFDGGDWVNRGFIEVEQGVGIWGVIDGGFDDQSLLKRVPGSAEMAAGFSFDFMKLINLVEGVIEKMPEEANAKGQYSQGRRMLGNMLGVDLKDDIFGTLGKDWVSYLDKNVGGTGPMGMVVLNKLADAEKFEASLLKLMKASEGLITKQLADQPVKIKFKVGEYDGIKVHYLGTPLVSPAWSIYEGHLYVGLFPQEVVGAIAYVRDGGKSLADHGGFKAAMQRDKRGDMVSFSWFDLPAAAEKHYSGTVMLGRTLMGAGDVFGVESPSFVVPPLYKVQEYLKPVTGFVRVADDGLSFSTREAFPGSRIFGIDFMSSQLQQPAFLVGLLTPALSTARASAQKVQDMNNIKQLLLSMHMYATDNGGQFPENRVMMYKLLNNTNVFFSATDRDANAHHFGDTDAEIEKFLSRSSIKFVWPLKKMSQYKNPSREIVIYKKQASGQVIVGMLDGHVETMQRNRFNQMLAAQRKRDGGVAEHDHGPE